jgi:DNA polymerase zeta
MSAAERVLGVTVFDIEFSLVPPDPLLGDAHFSTQLGRAATVVPVVHILGYTAAGQSAALHVHGLLPYFFVPHYDSALQPAAFAAQLEAAAVAAFKLPSTARVVHHVAIVEGIPFYGHYTTARRFLKIFLYRPSDINKLANLLGSSAHVAGRRWQPYEAHIPFHLQVQLDLGLRGMAPAYARRGALRAPLTRPSMAQVRGVAARGGRGGFLVTAEWAAAAGFPIASRSRPRLTVMDVEVDAAAADVFGTPEGPRSTRPGESFLSLRDALSSYLKDIGADADAVLNAAIAPDGLKRPSATEVQGADPFVVQVRRRAAQLALHRTAVKDPSQASLHEVKLDFKERRRASALLRHDACVAPTPTATAHVPGQIAPAGAFLSDVLRLEATRGGSPPQDVALTPPFQREIWARRSRPAPGDASLFDDAASSDDDDGELGRLATFQILNEMQDAGAPVGYTQLGCGGPGSDDGTGGDDETDRDEPDEPIVVDPEEVDPEETPLYQDRARPPSDTASVVDLEIFDELQPAVSHEAAAAPVGDAAVEAAWGDVPGDEFDIFRVTLDDMKAPTPPLKPHPVAALDVEETVGSARRMSGLLRCMPHSVPLLTTVTPRLGRKTQRAPVCMKRRVTAPAAAQALGDAGRIACLSVCCVELLVRTPKDQLAADAMSAPALAVSVLLATSALNGTRAVVFTTLPEVASPAPGQARLLRFETEAAMLQAALDLLKAENCDVICSWDLNRQGFASFVDRVDCVLGLDVSVVLSRFRSREGDDGAGRAVASSSDNEVESPPRAAPRSLAAVFLGDAGPAQGGDAARSAQLPLAGPPRQGGDTSMTRQVGQLKLRGRVVLSLAKAVRSEFRQSSYTLQAVHAMLFDGAPFPHFEDALLSRLALSQAASERQMALLHLIERSCAVLRIARHLDIFVRTAELAQIFGILFFEVLSRGSQFRVESTLLRFAHPLGYVMVSPSKEQVMLQNRQEGIALVLEPRSGFYRDPVLVLDFRSLYPSVAIAYNLCYCSLRGKVSEADRVKIGALGGYRPPQVGDGFNGEPDAVATYFDECTYAPSGATYVGKTEREGVLPMMLRCVLESRFQVQAAMKRAAACGDEEQRRVLDAQQTGLKLLANTTYGYASATFTGRMPCSDIADSIVLLGRATLERAIRTIEGNAAWAARVEYGDTDSLFVHLPGRTREAAFRIGAEIVTAVNKSNPEPVSLKLEKVYHPCFLVVKKRYVGYAYETPTQTVPKFDAKGIETVRRDQCGATAAILEQSLRLWFETQNVRALRSYVVEQLSKIQRGDMTPGALVLRSDVKLGTYASEQSLPPAARVAMRQAQRDPTAMPAYGDRIAYAVVHTQDARLRECAVPGVALLKDRSLVPHGPYYIAKHLVPTLERIFHLIGVDVAAWARSMPRQRRRSHLFEPALVTWRPFMSASGARAAARTANDHTGGVRAATLDQFFQSALCAVCRRAESRCAARGMPPVCDPCLGRPIRAAVTATVARRAWIVAQGLHELDSRCNTCTGGALPLASAAITAACVSLDCPVTFERQRLERLLDQLRVLEAFLRVAPAPEEMP